MNRGVKLRLLLLCIGLALVYTLYSMRLVHVQVFQHEKYLAMATETRSDKVVIASHRGRICDVNGEVVADDEPLRDIVADGVVMTKGREAEIAAEVAGPLGLDPAELEKTLRTDDPYRVIRRQVPEQQAAAIESALAARDLRGIRFERSFRRMYPNGRMLSHVIGFINGDGVGADGVERSMQEELKGSDGFRIVERDRRGRELVVYRGAGRAARNGGQIRLTVDLGLQHIVESELEAACAQFKPESATVVMMRPATGEILALANRPDFDPALGGKGEPSGMINRSVLAMVEPGSTFKIVTAAAALEEGRVTLDSVVQCEGGQFAYGGKILRDHHGYGPLSVEDVLAKSSNIGSAKLAMMLGDDALYEYVRRFGFGERTGVELPGEIPGLVHPPHRWTKISITRIPMGHEVAVTPIQLVAAMSAVANGGRLMLPQIVRDISDETGNPRREFAPVEIRRVISEETSRCLVRALKKVVSKQGTAALAMVPGFAVAGKTGTAQKIDPKGGYAPGKYVVSFLGFLPADDPQMTVLVMMDEAKTAPGMNYGGQVCAPVFSRIADRAARHMNLVPEPLEEPETTIVKREEGR
jgi:cell division protein FtsI (penicillin-binding protein 3)/stage V sporulation protein D (sporulation-specific penicillin-binding protein)